jgi:hypothetical protein
VNARPARGGRYSQIQLRERATETAVSDPASTCPTITKACGLSLTRVGLTPQRAQAAMWVHSKALGLMKQCKKLTYEQAVEAELRHTARQGDGHHGHSTRAR